ncbi:B- and T-lymphocyte attenuator-like [Thunnus albacares]|uniref:B- and T-lymphocyte attenuator-like n=1 Tax=Thunnus albacares TaxID=8236 RepID=UPI001CF70FD8|nr:B- and T-lymphocyte attenuator-like [Thunnus albacares]
MTGGFLSVSIMRPNPCWTILHVSILAGLLLTLNVESEESDCDPGINVRRNTVHEALLGEDLTINCTVTFCNNSPPTVSWYKLENTPVPVNFNSSPHIKTEWEASSPVEGILFLTFQNIQRNDSGQYRCQSGGNMGHAINVSIYGNIKPPIDTGKNETNNMSNPNTTPQDNMLMYVYSAAGIVGFVIVVIIISMVSMLGCKGKPKKETSTENQYMAMPMVEQAFPQASLQPSSREGPSVPPTRRSTRKKMPPSQRNESTLPEDHLYGVIKEDDERQRNVAEEEGSSVVYAALNHQRAPAAAARPRIQIEESSEYAAIRVP